MNRFGVFVSQTVDQVYLGADRPLGPNRRLSHTLDDVFGGPDGIGSLNDVETALRMGYHANVRMAFPDSVYVFSQETSVDRTVPLPEHNPAVDELLARVPTQFLIGIPRRHRFEAEPELIACVSVSRC